ncbi:DNA primase large subunit Spp2 [Savitreella phatthalungensis]
MPSRSRAFGGASGGVGVAEDDDDVDGVGQVQAITEFSLEAHAEAEAARKLKETPIVAKQANTIRYRPVTATDTQALGQGRSAAEIEAEERAGQGSYGLTERTAAAIPDEPQHGTTTVASQVTRTSNGGGRTLHMRPAARDASHPDSATLDDYAAMPVEQFGLAMLRGMGYVPPKEDSSEDSGDEYQGDGREKKRRKSGKRDEEEKKIKRRPDFLGLGAKEEPLPVPEPGERKPTEEEQRKLDAEKRRQARSFLPLMKVDRQTGKRIVEDRSQGDAPVRSDRSDSQETGRSRNDDRDIRRRRERSYSPLRSSGDGRAGHSRGRRDSGRRRQRERETDDNRRNSERERDKHSRRHRDDYDRYARDRHDRHERSKRSERDDNPRERRQSGLYR